MFSPQNYVLLPMESTVSFLHSLSYTKLYDFINKIVSHLQNMTFLSICSNIFVFKAVQITALLLEKTQSSDNSQALKQSIRFSPLTALVCTLVAQVITNSKITLWNYETRCIR